MAISRESVLWGFRLVLGREPDSEEGIQAHLSLDSETALVETLLRSPEFSASGRFASVLRLREGATVQAGPTWRHQSRSDARIMVLGNCQAAGLGELFQALTGGAAVETIETTPSFLARLQAGELDLRPALRKADVIFVQMVGQVTDWIGTHCPREAHKVRQIPPLAYAGFHPDCVYVTRADGRHLQGAMGEYHSSIAFAAWQAGLDADQALSLFRAEVYEALGFQEHHPAAYRTLLEHGKRCGLSLAPLVDSWRARGCFMHSVNHPKLFALADLAALVLEREGIAPLRPAAEWVDDRLARWPVWPLYPPLAHAEGLQGEYLFKLDRGHCPPGQPVLTLTLEEFVKASYAAYSEPRQGGLQCKRTAGQPAYESLPQFAATKPARWRQWVDKLAAPFAPRAADAATVTSAARENPYAGLADHHFWRRAVERVEPSSLDPVTRAKWPLGREQKVATAGSCFAQHIARHLSAAGFGYMVVDADTALPEATARERNFGVYSARYGNVYTAQQLVQLFDRAHGAFAPLDEAWQRSSDNRWVDPFRPQIEPAGYATAQEVVKARDQHLTDVRRMFAELDVFIFTLGLTEAWRRKQDGAVYPLAPGVAGGRYDPAQHEFVNYTAAEVTLQLRNFIRRLRTVNPGAKVLFTVSPVPLVATYEDRHVLTSTVYSKSVLRAAAGAVAEEFAEVEYFPSYEIITGPQARGSYFEGDLRSVTEAGVNHVMQIFFRNYALGQPTSERVPRQNRSIGHHDLDKEHDDLGRLVCEEELLDRHRAKGEL